MTRVSESIRERGERLSALDLRQDAAVTLALREMEALGQVRDREAALAVMPFLLAPSWPLRSAHENADRRRHVELAEASRRAACEILACLPAHELIGLDRMVRAASPWGRGAHMPWHDWAKFDAADLKHVLPVDGTRLSVLALLSCHRSGYVREAALLEMLGFVDGFTFDEALPWLVLRINDFVEVIRMRAQEAVRARMSTKHATAFLGVLPLVERLGGFSRLDHRAFIADVRSFLARQDRALLRDGLSHGDREVRRATLRLLADHGALDLEMATLAFEDEDVRMRSDVARRTAEHTGEGWRALRVRLLDDPVGRVRAMALRLLVDAPGAPADAHLRAGLMDRSGAVREIAQYHLQHTLDLPAHYRRSVDEEPSVGAIRGLAELGSKDDWERLVPMLDERSPLARAAVTAMAKLDESASRETRLMMVDSPESGVSKDAAATLRRSVWASDEATLLAYLASPHEHVRKATVPMLMALPAWTCAQHMLSLRDPALEKLVRLHFERWLARRVTWGAPPDEAHATMLRQLVRTSPLITEGQRERTLKLLDFL